MAWKEILQHQWALDYVCFIDAEDCLENWLKNQNEDIYGIATYQNWKKQHLLRQKARVSPFRYISPSRKAGRGTYAIEMSRGCPHSKCTFCSQSCGNVYKEKWLPLPMDVIRNEIISIYERYGVSRFATSDDDLLGPNKYNLTRALEVRDMVKSLPFPISFSASISVNAACSEQILDILEDAGLEQLCIGFESADEQQLRRYGKAQNLEANFKAAENLSKRNLQILPGLITFDPYSSVESIKKNLSFLFDNLKHFNISKLTKRLHLLTGSPFVKMCRKDNLLTGDYLGYDYVFQDGRIEVIYKILNQYVNLVREVEQSLKSNNLVAASEIRKHHRNAVFHILSGNSIDEYILNEINILKNYRDFQI